MPNKMMALVKKIAGWVTVTVCPCGKLPEVNTALLEKAIAESLTTIRLETLKEVRSMAFQDTHLVTLRLDIDQLIAYEEKK